MINILPVTTVNGHYKAMHCDTENGTLFYGVDLFHNGSYQFDVATFQVHSDGSAEGFASKLGVYVVSDESRIFAELVEAIDGEESSGNHGYL